MSFIVKGMEMPVGCADCPMIYDCEWCLEGDVEFRMDDYICKRHDSCKLVEIPDNHGKIIDSDKLESIYETMIEINREFINFNIKDHFMVLKDYIDILPAILEKENESED